MGGGKEGPSSSVWWGGWWVLGRRRHPDVAHKLSEDKTEEHVYIHLRRLEGTVYIYRNFCG